MPLVGMRRSTRVFGARVLRSGRRLWTEPNEGSKHVRAAHEETKFPELRDNSADRVSDANVHHIDMWHENDNAASVDMAVEPRTEELAPDSAVEVKNVDRMFGLVYRRKRKRGEATDAVLTEDKRYGEKFARKQWRERRRALETYAACGDLRDSISKARQLAIVVNESSCDFGYWITSFLTSVLSYMTRARIGMRQLLAFLLSKPISDAFSSHGILILQDPIASKKSCVCVISGSRCFMPLFSVDILAIPSFFVHMQTNMFLRLAHLDCLLVARYEKDEKVTDVADDAKELSFQIPFSRDQQDYVSVTSQISSPGRDASDNDVVASDNDTLGRRRLSHAAFGLHKSALRSLQLRNSRNIQKRRSSLRSKRGRPPSAFRAHRATGDFFRIRHDGVQFSAAAPSHLLRSSERRSSTTNIKELKLATRGDVCPSSCSGNLLITETEKCYRVEGATITLELSSSNRWSLAVTKGGTKQCNLTAEKVMRPSCSNRITHAVMWTVDCGWKLEFPKKQDWLIFKELYKECYERNMQSPVAASVIPVPGVQEVSSPVDCHYNIPFTRPDSYITVKDDELTRALLKKNVAIYDMDSDDEEWLEKLNNKLYTGRELEDLITPESFELVIDALEKAVHCNPDEHLEQQAVYDFCMHLERREVIEAIHTYWITKRKQKRAALVRIFQLYQPRRSQVIPKAILRKKRSFKRQASQGGRGKQRPLLQAIAAERDALEQQNNTHKLQEAKAAADRYEELAILKRERAQMLMGNADLATYKAIMAIRIAEAAQIDEAPDIDAFFFLG